MNEGSLVDTAVNAASAGAGVGGGFFVFRWFFGLWTRRLERREDQLDKQETKIDGEWATIREEMRGRLTALEAQAERHAEQNTALRLAFEIVAGELRARDPHNMALTRAEQILAVAFPLTLNTPPEIGGAIIKLDDVGGTPSN